ncbi:hypothetical protein QQ045_029205 [Rhodiola kirilowii]
MAPESYSLFLSPFTFSLPKTSALPSIRSGHRLNLILCKYDTAREPAAASTSEPDGLGSAAPTRGEIFLQHYQSVEASKMVLEVSKKERRKKKIVMAEKRIGGGGGVVKGSFSGVACCYGCGAPLQILEKDAPGYVDQDLYDLKKKHRQLNTVLCGRCRLLSHGHMITAVGGNGGYPGGKQFVTAEELREKLSHVRHEKALIVKLVDIVDFNGSFLARIRDLAGANPIILVLTKVDLLPKGTDLNCIGDWVVEATMKKKLNVLSVHLTSSKSMIGIAGVSSEIQREKRVSFILSVGSANVGKSAFINAMLKMMGEKDPVAAAAQKYKPIQSAVPGTTLGPIQIEAFLGGGKIYDTPGVHLHHRQAAVVHSEDLPALAPQSRLRRITVPVASDMKTFKTITHNGLNEFSIIWGGLARVDVLKVQPQTCLTFYGPKALQVHLVPLDEADEFYQKQVGVLLTPPTGKQRTNEWMGLETRRQLKIEFEDWERPACDIHISGLGWISVEPARKGFDPVSEDEKKELHVAVWVPKPVEIFTRPAMPVSKAGAELYEYRDLTEKEQEARPKCPKIAMNPDDLPPQQPKKRIFKPVLPRRRNRVPKREPEGDDGAGLEMLRRFQEKRDNQKLDVPKEFGWRVGGRFF